MKKLFFIPACTISILFSNFLFSQTTFSYTGAVQYWTVPAGISTITITAKGAQGGGVNGGLGATVNTILSVIPGQTLQINVGGQGLAPMSGWNGGGAGQTATTFSDYSYGGGGATDIRVAPFALSNRVIVSAGGGGMSGGDVDQIGGNGGCTTGVNGSSTFGGEGFGGTQTAGGIGGPSWGPGGSAGGNGMLGIGGSGGLDNQYNLGPGGGGGGGYYGGGGGGSDDWSNYPLGGGGGGGGSSFVPVGGSCTAGNNQGNGIVILQWSIPPCTTLFAKIDSVITPTSCSGNSGAIYLSDSTIAPPLTYSWSNSATTQDITGLSPGTYYVIITDSSGCVATLGATISSPSSILISVDSIKTVACGGASIGEIYLSASGGAAPYYYNWSNGATTSFITGLANGTYSVTVTDSNSCTAFTSISNAAPPNLPNPVLCMVTVDSFSQNNVIMWDKTLYPMADSFIVYREVGLNDYQPIGSVQYNSLSLLVDTMRTKYFPNTGDPNTGTYKYKIAIMDSCGEISQLSQDHNTIFIINNNGVFSWSQLYLIGGIINPVYNYILMRDNNNNGNWTVVNSVTGSQQTVVDPQYATYQGTAKWRVETQWTITCTPTRINPSTASFNSSLSNISSNINSVNEFDWVSDISVYPNPSNGKFTLMALEFKVQNVKVYDLVGSCIYQSTNQQVNQSTIDLSEKPEGIYFLHIKTSNGIIVKKLVKE